MIQFLNGAFESDGKRPGGHLNQGVIAEMLDDIIKQGARYSDVEAQIEIDFNLSGSFAKTVAKKIKASKFLSKYDFAVCHKIPYSAFERALIDLMNKRIKGTDTPLMWHLFTNLNQAVGGQSMAHGMTNYYKGITTALQNAIQPHSTNLASSLANTALNEFDKGSDNLFFGFGSTNSSISDNIDLHFNLDDPNDDVPPTPRGLDLKTALNQFEVSVGRPKTTAIESTSKGVRWVMSSTTYGTKSQGYGYVSTTAWTN